MKNDQITKILIFRTDRIGDLVNTSPILKSLKNYYNKSEIHLVCSKYNSAVALNYDFIDKVLIYDINSNLLTKIKFFLKTINIKYTICVPIDGKKISKLVTLFIKAKQKYIISFKKEKKIFGIKINIFRPSLLFCKIFFDTYIICDENYNKKNVNLEFNNHYLSMYYYLFKKNNIKLISEKHVFNIEKNSSYTFKKFFMKHVNNIFINIHIDYKWDKHQIDFNKFILFLKKISSIKKVIISSGKEGSFFFDKLKNKFNSYSFDNLNSSKSISTNRNILLIENLSINLLACFLKESSLNISSHSGAIVQISAAFNVPIIDFIKKNQKNEYDRWVPPSVEYSQIFIDKLDELEASINKKNYIKS